MKKLYYILFGILCSVLFLSNLSINSSTSFIMSMVTEGPQLPETPFTYSDIEFPEHLFDDTKVEDIGYDRGGRPDPETFETITDHGATLGRVLFYDKKLSAIENISCGTCHHQELSFTESKAFSEGVNTLTKRNSMHLNDLLWTSGEHFTWDMRSNDLHEMIILPLTDENEIGANIEDVKIKLDDTDYYPMLFANAFGDPEITEERIVEALVQFITSMTTFNSKFDEGVKTGFVDFSPAEIAGRDIFKRDCAACHVQGKHTVFGGEIFGEDILEAFPFIFNNGLPEDPDDAGVGEWNENMSNLFKVPTLRNIELTGPYMHDGRFLTLEEVVDHYSEGIVSSEWSFIFLFEPGFDYSDDDKSHLISFLNTLTDETFLTNPRWSDPFGLSSANEENKIANISLSPNPMNHSAVIRFNNLNNENVSINIMTADGRLVKHDIVQSDTYELNKADFHEGMYFVNLMIGNKKATQKMIIQ